MRPPLYLTVLASLTLSTATGQDFGPRQIISGNSGGARSAFAVDLDGDGDADVLSASWNDDKIAWYENQGGGSFGPQQVITTKTNGPRDVFATDLDGDGDADVLSASYYDSKIAWFENLGGGAFGPQQVITKSAAYAVSTFAIDLDGDGDTDVLSASGGGTDRIAWYENQGGGVFGTQQVITTSVDGAEDVYAIDLDGDGDADVLSASRWDHKIAWYENQGGGVIGPQQVITTDARLAGAVSAIDLDGDGDADVLSTSRMDDTIAWYENLGGGVFGTQRLITDETDEPMAIFAADLDGDGDEDVLAASLDDNKISWCENLMGSPACNIVFCDTDPDNLGDVTLSTCDCSAGSIFLSLSSSFANQFTYPLVGLGTAAVSPTGVSQLCLAGSTIGRYSQDAGSISGWGTFSIDLLNATSAPGGGVPTVGGALCNGNTWRFQYWHRDGMNPSRFSKGIQGMIN